MDDITTILFALGFVLVVSLVCGFIGGKIGDSRGRGTAGFWLGFLIGPLGCLVALFLPRDTPSDQPRTPASASSAVRFCSLCGKHVDRYTRTCPECGNAI